MLNQFGRPYQSTKGRPGSGLGLFLSLNVARSLGGNITPQNRETQGALVTITLPLTSLRIEEDNDD
jgi:two-component system sensor histidine kinase RegB